LIKKVGNEDKRGKGKKEGVVKGGKVKKSQGPTQVQKGRGTSSPREKHKAHK